MELSMDLHLGSSFLGPHKFWSRWEANKKIQLVYLIKAVSIHGTNKYKVTGTIPRNFNGTLQNII